MTGRLPPAQAAVLRYVAEGKRLYVAPTTYRGELYRYPAEGVGPVPVVTVPPVTTRALIRKGLIRRAEGLRTIYVLTRKGREAIAAARRPA